MFTTDRIMYPGEQNSNQTRYENRLDPCEHKKIYVPETRLVW